MLQKAHTTKYNAIDFCNNVFIQIVSHNKTVKTIKHKIKQFR